LIFRAVSTGRQFVTWYGKVRNMECVGHSLKLLDIFQKIWTPLRKLFIPLGVLCRIRACVHPTLNLKSFSWHGKSY